jgi:prophage antirepressor-like protein
MNELQVFEKAGLGSLRITMINNKEAFNLSDTCLGLGYAKISKNNAYLRKDAVEEICESLGITGLSPSDNFIKITRDIDFENTYISEESFYDLSLESKAKHARTFRKWVTSEVLPSIRKHGVFMTTTAIEKTLADPDFIINLATQLKTEREANLQLEQENKILKPKAEIYDEVMNSDGLLNMKEIADSFGVGRNTFFNIFRQEGILSSNKSNWNLPLGNYHKYFEVKVTPFRTNEGVQEISTTLGKTKVLKLAHKVLKKRNLVSAN